MQYGDEDSASWFDDVVEPSSEFRSDIAQLCTQAPLVRVCVEDLGEAPHAVRFLRSVSRERDEIALNDWVLLQSPDVPAAVGCVRMMCELRFTGDCSAGSSISSESKVRLLVEECAHPERRGDELVVMKRWTTTDRVVRFESTVVTVVSRTQILYPEHTEIVYV